MFVQRIMAAKGLEEGQIIVDWLGNMTQVGFALHCTGLLVLHCVLCGCVCVCVSLCVCVTVSVCVERTRKTGTISQVCWQCVVLVIVQ